MTKPAKRAATRQLTHDNWDEDDEYEAPGTYQTVGDAALQNRVIKRAKRSLPPAEEDDLLISSNPFMQFSGFGRKPVVKSLFNVGTISDSGASQNTDAEKGKPLWNGTEALQDKLVENTKLPTENSLTPHPHVKEMKSPSKKKQETRDIEYYRELKALNDGVMKWTTMHFSKNPWCDFTPVFEDYKKHLDSIDRKYPLKVKSILTAPLSKPFASFKVPSPPVCKVNNAVLEEKQSCGEPAAKISRTEVSTSSSADGTKSSGVSYGTGFKSSIPTFTFCSKFTATTPIPSSNPGPTTSSSEMSPVTAISTRKSSEGANPSGMLSAKPFTFAVSPLARPENCNGLPSNVSKTKEEEDDYVPPKNEFTVVEEEGAFYTKRCKLFYKNDESYVEKGVGTLYLKPIDLGTQLLIRAATNLGNILLNIKLSASLPVQRMGKKDVLLVCVPNPPIAPGNAASKDVVPLLIRVKSSDDADELADKLNQYKG